MGRYDDLYTPVRRKAPTRPKHKCPKCDFDGVVFKRGGGYVVLCGRHGERAIPDDEITDEVRAFFKDS